MSRREILTTKYGEMLDMIACLAIYNGAEPAKKKKKKKYTFDEALALL